MKKGDLVPALVFSAIAISTWAGGYIAGAANERRKTEAVVAQIRLDLATANTKLDQARRTCEKLCGKSKPLEARPVMPEAF